MLIEGKQILKKSGTTFYSKKKWKLKLERKIILTQDVFLGEIWKDSILQINEGGKHLFLLLSVEVHQTPDSPKYSD